MNFQTQCLLLSLLILFPSCSPRFSVLSSSTETFEQKVWLERKTLKFSGFKENNNANLQQKVFELYLVVFFSLMATNNNNKSLFIIWNLYRWKLMFSFSMMDGGYFRHLQNSHVIVLELKKWKTPNNEDCNSLVLHNLWDISFEDSNVAQTQTQQLTIYRNFPNIVLQYHYFINMFSTCTRRQAALKYKYWRWNTYAAQAAWKAHLAFYV